MCSNPSKRRRRPTFIIPPLSRASSVPILSRRQSPPTVILRLVRAKGVNTSRLSIQMSYGSLVNFSAFRELETCCSSSLQARFVSIYTLAYRSDSVACRVRASSLVTRSSSHASSIGWSLIAQRTSSPSCQTTRLLSSFLPLGVRRA